MSEYRNGDPRQIAVWLKALSNPNRLEIFLRLVEQCGRGSSRCTQDDMRSCVGELGRDLRIGASTVSHHVKELRQAGLVHMERRGQTIECSVEQESLRALAGFFAELVPAGSQQSNQGHAP